MLSRDTKQTKRSGDAKQQARPTGTGIVDQPLAQDFLDIGHYVTGLSDFISACQTPLTVAVQGDWGSGKTNMMQMVEQRITRSPYFRLSDPRPSTQEHIDAAPTFSIRFNTWQYSQFDLSDRLILSLLESIGNQLLVDLDAKSTSRAKRTQFTRTLLNVTSAAALGTAESALATIGLGAVFSQVQQAVASSVEAGARPSPDRDLATLLVEVRAGFAAAVAELVQFTSAAGEVSHGRLVIFIDDLDRLEPRRAVELMEALKLFLDVEHCVFVLAIDFGVVEQGVASKYGESFDSGKARSFFDKIIQVPFQMPLGAYRIELLLRETLGATGLTLTGAAQEAFQSLISLSVRNNPRSIKRLVNTFVLLRNIAGLVQGPDGGSAGEDEQRDLQLFAILCLQTAYPQLYEHISDTTRADASEALTNDAFLSEQAPETLRAWGLASDADTAQAFLAEMRRAFSAERGEFDPSQLAEVLWLAATTSSGHQAVRPRGSNRYTANERSELFAAKVKNAEQYDLLGPERFVAALAALEPALRVGAQLGTPTLWVVGHETGRIGTLTVRREAFQLRFQLKRGMRAVTPRQLSSRFEGSSAAAELLATLAGLEPDEPLTADLSLGSFAGLSEERAGELAEFWVQLCRAFIPQQ